MRHEDRITMRSSDFGRWSQIVLCLLIASSVHACAPSGSSGPSPVAATLAFIREFGFPGLAELIAPLPPQLARVSGVETNASGLPSIPDALSNQSFGSSSSSLNAVLADAQALSAQGFSEARRLEAMVQNLAGPVYDVLGRKDLFTRGASAGAVKAMNRALQEVEAGLSNSAAGNIFSDLAANLSYAVEMDAGEGMPSHLILGVERATSSIVISGVWPSAVGADGAALDERFHTGFQAKVRLNSLEDFDVALTLAPSQLSGFLSEWKAGSCEDDLWQVAFGATAISGRSLRIKAHECPSTRDAVSMLEFGQASGDEWSLRGGFVQNFEDSDSDSLRGWLGKRQGFVIQAAASGDLDAIAAAAAVLGESDFATPDQEAIERFGVGELLARFFQAKYLQPRIAEAKAGSLFTQYENLAYWLCIAPGVSDAVQDEVATVAGMCAGKSLDVEATLSALTSLEDAIEGAFLVPDDIKQTVDALIQILSIRNSLYLSSEGKIAYKNAPNEAFAALDTVRKQALPESLGDSSWRAEAAGLLPTLAYAEIPDTPYKAIASGIAQFLAEECLNVAEASAEKAGKALDAAELCND